MGSKGRGYWVFRLADHEVWVGKGASENDRLSLDLADPDDLWLHVAGGTAGSHVVIRTPDPAAEIPPEVVRRAAELAAYHSKARNARGKVAVHLCRARDVSKRRGAPAGQVQIRDWREIKVYPRAAEDLEAE